MMGNQEGSGHAAGHRHGVWVDLLHSGYPVCGSCIYILFENIRTKVMGERKKFRQIEEITEEIIPGH